MEARPRPPGPGTGAPGTTGASVRPNANSLQILSNIPNLVTLYNSGKLTDANVDQLRKVLSTHIRSIVSFAIQSGKPNPVKDLPDAIDPSKPWKGVRALITKEQFDNEVRLGELEGRQKLANPLGAAGGSGQGQGQGQGQGGATPGTGATGPGGAAVRPGRPAGMMPADEFSRLIRLGAARAQNFVGNPELLGKFREAFMFQAVAQGIAPQEAANRYQAQINNQNAWLRANGGGVLPTVPPPVPAPPPKPVETEGQRRKRRFREYVAESAPGLEMEVGILDVLGDVLDSFVDDAGRNAARLAKHRKSEKVEMKDVAFYLIPGFNHQITDRVRGPNEGKKMVTRSAAKRNQ